MKIRQGFVSNSSSSSFIMIGVDSNLIKTPYDKDKGIQDLYIERVDVDEISGFILSDDEYLEDGTLPITKINSMSDELSRLLNVDISYIKLYYGIRPS